MTIPRSLLLCTSPRSGSTLMCDLLAGTGVLGSPATVFAAKYMSEYAQEYGLPEAVQADPQGHFPAYLEGVIQAGSSSNGRFSTRVQGWAFPELQQWLGELHPEQTRDAERFKAAFGPSLYLHLTRRDKLAQAISYTMAEFKGIWHRHADGSIREGEIIDTAPPYDAMRIRSNLDALSAQDDTWRAWFEAEGITPLTVTYEDLAENPRAALARVLTACGEDAALAEQVEVKTTKLADAVSQDWAERFR